MTPRAILGARCLFLLLMSVWAISISRADTLSKVDNSTLTGKLILGYQGWFACPEADGRWDHWFAEGQSTVDMLPDMSEYRASDSCSTPYQTADGTPIKVFSSTSPDVIDRHFAWMKTYGLDGVAVQRFGVILKHEDTRRRFDTVLRLITAAAERHGRVFYVMYDLSGLKPEDLALLVRDWKDLRPLVIRSPAYLHHKGAPLLGVWGLGFRGRPIDPHAAQQFLAGIRSVGAVSLIGGVPGAWRTNDKDADPNPAWQAVYQQFQVISPWTVGRYRNSAEVASWFEGRAAADIAMTIGRHQDYMPVVFPGFSWSHLQSMHHKSQPLNAIPRRCGTFYWDQIVAARRINALMTFNAMFDEVDEGTAMFKTLENKGETEVEPPFLTLDEDGCNLPSDWYLRLAGAATKLLTQRLTSPAVAFPLTH